MIDWLRREWLPISRSTQTTRRLTSLGVRRFLVHDDQPERDTQPVDLQETLLE